MSRFENLGVWLCILVTHGALGTILVYLGGGYRVGFSIPEFQYFYSVLRNFWRCYNSYNYMEQSLLTSNANERIVQLMGSASRCPYLNQLLMRNPL